MNKTKVFSAVFALMFSCASLNAQSFKDILTSSTTSDVVSSVTGGLTITDSNIVGTWKYVEPAVELKSDSALSNAAGSLASSQIEDKLNKYCSKVGITAGKFAFVFNSDGTFTSNVGSKSLGGSYSVDSETGKITLSYKAINTIKIGTLTASTTLTSNSLALLFPADNLLKLLSAVASVSSRAELQLVKTITEQYNGVGVGFSFSGKVATTSAASTATDVKNAVNAISKFF